MNSDEDLEELLRTSCELTPLDIEADDRTKTMLLGVKTQQDLREMYLEELQKEDANLSDSNPKEFPSGIRKFFNRIIKVFSCWFFIFSLTYIFLGGIENEISL